MIWKWIKKNNLKKGMTLIEMIVVIALIFIISATTWVNYRNLGKSLALDRSANQVARDIRASLEMAMSMQDIAIPAGLPGSCNNTGYGIDFETKDSEYRAGVYFYNNGGNVPPGCGPVIIPLEEGTSIVSIKLDGSSSNSLGIMFVPPHPRIYIMDKINFNITDGSTYFNQAIITLESEEGDTKTITINRSGLIEIGNEL